MTRIFGCLLAIAAVLCGAIAIGQGAGSSSDPYYLVPVQNAVGVSRVSPYTHSGFVQKDCRASLGTKKVIVIAGQSVSANNVSASYTVTQANNWQLDLQNGGCYGAGDPTLGATISGGIHAVNIGSWGNDLGDRLITAADAAHVITANIAVGGTNVAQWAAGGFLNGSIGVTGRRLSDNGLTCTHIIWGQGENDHGTTGPAYTASLTSVINTFRTAGMSCPFLVLVETMLAGSNDATVAGAQAAMTGTNVFVGFNMDTGVPNSGGNRYDGTHLAAPGRALAAAGIRTSVIAH